MAAYLLCLHAAALASLAPLSVPAWVKFGAVLPLGWSVLHGLRRHAWRSALDAVAALRLQADGTVELRHRGGSIDAAAVEASSTLLPFAVVMRVRFIERHGGRAVVLAPDTLNREDLRALRVWLRWRAKPAEQV